MTRFSGLDFRVQLAIPLFLHTTLATSTLDTQHHHHPVFLCSIAHIARSVARGRRGSAFQQANC